MSHNLQHSFWSDSDNKTKQLEYQHRLQIHEIENTNTTMEFTKYNQNDIYTGLQLLIIVPAGIHGHLIKYHHHIWSAVSDMV